MSAVSEDVPTRPRGRTAAAVLLVVEAALVVAGVLLVLNPRATGAPHNTALVDTAGTSQVIGQVSTALNQVLSYDYASPATNEAAAKKWLAGDAVGQYRTLFQQLNQRAAGQKLSFVAKVVSAGVTSLEGDRAQLLVFLDQKSTRASDGKSSIAAAQVMIGAEKQDGTWRITELHPL